MTPSLNTWLRRALLMTRNCAEGPDATQMPLKKSETSLLIVL
jgi:hypothetical protein